MQSLSKIGNMTKMKIEFSGQMHTKCTHPSGSTIETDAPKDIQGKGEEFSPTDLFAVSVGSCMLTLMGIRGKQLGIELKGMTAEVEKHMATAPVRKVGKIIIRIRSSYSPDQMTQSKLEQAAIDCPVHLSLHPDVKVELDFVWGL